VTEKTFTTGPLTVKSALMIAGLALLVGTAFDLFGRTAYPGIGFTLVTLSMVAALALAGRRRRAEGWVLMGAALVLAAFVAIRSADYLQALDMATCIGLLSLAALSLSHRTRIAMFRGRDLIVGWSRQLAAALAGAAAPLSALVENRTLLRLHGAAPYMRGLLAAVPVFAIFALLLGAGDAAFADFLDSVFPRVDISLGSTGQHVLWIAAATWVAAGLIAFAASPAKTEPAAGAPPRRFSRFGHVELMIVLGSVTALFALFVIFQFAYFFGGESHLRVSGLTYAQYAREGFFQLLAVAVLTALLVRVAMHISAADRGTRRHLAFQALCTVLIALTGVILLSALKRLGLYEQAYGWTRMRFLSHAFCYLVAAVLILLAAQLYWSRRHVLLAGTIGAGFLTLTAVNAVNPDAYIAKRNIGAFKCDSRTGLGYLSELSADAVPSVVASAREGGPLFALRDEVDAWACESTLGQRGTAGGNLAITRARNARKASGLDQATSRWVTWQEICE
jgi:hypothetical protein